MYLMHLMRDADIVVAHVNYGYRHDSWEDEKLVRETAETYGRPFQVLHPGNIPHTGFEEWARKVRYWWFMELQAKYRSRTVIVAHTANDQAETVVMHRERGCSLYGEGGMRSTEWLQRPLLGTLKSEVYSRARELGLAWREDYTNQDDRFTRNRIRKTLDDTDVLRICAEAKAAQERYAWLLREAEVAYAPVRTFDTLVLPKPREIEMWNTLVYDFLHGRSEIQKKHFDLMHSDLPSAAVVDLPGGWVCYKRKSREVRFFKQRRKT